ncbi:MAG TPA: nucleotide exchange factor GrpE [Coleofasciculaceae cyanobacterium]|jgi:molecular chaperone GrpE
MIDEENQPDNTAQQTEEPSAVSQENRSGDSAATEADLNGENVFQSPSIGDQHLTEESVESIATDDGKKTETVGTQAAEESSPDRDLAALETLKQENEALKAQLEELAQQNDSMKIQSVRIAADFDNFRKRTAKEKEDLEQQVKRVTLSELLPVVDNFERARSQIKPQTDGEMSIHKSYQGVYKQLVDSLKRLGVAPMRPEGKEFDPNLHEAVMREPSNEYAEGVVIEQLMRGYFLGERVLRHAMVKVAAAPENPSEDSSENPEASSG